MARIRVVRKEDVDRLVELINVRDVFVEWSEDWEEYSRKVKDQLQYIENNMIEIDA